MKKMLIWIPMLILLICTVVGITFQSLDNELFVLDNFDDASVNSTKWESGTISGEGSSGVTESGGFIVVDVEKGGGGASRATTYLTSKQNIFTAYGGKIRVLVDRFRYKHGDATDYGNWSIELTDGTNRIELYRGGAKGESAYQINDTYIDIMKAGNYLYYSNNSKDWFQFSNDISSWSTYNLNFTVDVVDNDVVVTVGAVTYVNWSRYVSTNTTPNQPEYNQKFNITAREIVSGANNLRWFITKPDGTVLINNQSSESCSVNSDLYNRTCLSPSVHINGSTSGIGTWTWNYTATDISYGDYTETGSFIIGKTYYLNETTAYTTTVEESDLETFSSNVTVNDNFALDLSTATLTYNSTNHTATVTKINSTLYHVSRQINVPIVQTSGTAKHFNWTYEFYTIDGTYTSNISQAYTQTINKMAFAQCSGGANATLNFSFWNEQDRTQNLTASIFKATFEIWKSTDDTYSTYSYDLTNVSEATFCIPVNQTYYTNAMIEYQVSGYDTRHYYLRNNTLSNAIQQIRLYNLDITLGDGVQFYVVDSSGQPEENIYGYVQRYDVGGNTYYTVDMLRSDENGEDYLYLRKYDAYYRFILFDEDGTIVYTGIPKKLASTSETLKINPTTYGELYEYSDGVARSLVFNNLTSSFIATWSDTTGRTTEANLLVLRRVGLRDIPICDTTASTPSGTLTCTGINGTGVYVATLTTDNGVKNLLTLYHENPAELSSLLGKTGLLITGLLCLVLFFIGAQSYSLSGGVLGLLLGIFISKSVGFLQLDWYFIIGIFITGGIASYLMRD